MPWFYLSSRGVINVRDCNLKLTGLDSWSTLNFFPRLFHQLFFISLLPTPWFLSTGEWKYKINYLHNFSEKKYHSANWWIGELDLRFNAQFIHLSDWYTSKERSMTTIAIWLPSRNSKTVYQIVPRANFRLFFLFHKLIWYRKKFSTINFDSSSVNLSFFPSIRIIIHCSKAETHRRRENWRKKDVKMSFEG